MSATRKKTDKEVSCSSYFDLVGGGGGGGGGEKQLSFSALTQHQIPGGSPYTQACSHNHWYSEMTV